jgi:lipid-A-disaccharide synthase
VTKRIFLVAAEASGDALGADLIVALKAKDPSLDFSGCGGVKMAGQGMQSVIDIAPLSVFGLLEGLMAYKRVIRAADAVADAAVAFNPDVAVLIDSWGFTLRVAQRLRQRLPNLKLVKYVGPQVWASRPGRAKALAATVDHLIAIHHFERPFYAPYGLPVTVSGPPALDRIRPGDAAAFRARHALTAGEEILLLLPGSRPAEIKRVAPTLEAAAAQLCATRPDVIVACVVAASVADAVKSHAATWQFPHRLVEDEHEKEDAFAAAAVALAASGTVTTEVGLQGTPVVVGYKIGWVTWALLRLFLLRTRYITLMNVAAGKEVSPEFVQTRFSAANIVAAAAPLLDNRTARNAQIAAQNAALDAMGRGGRPAAEIAAETVLSVISGR